MKTKNLLIVIAFILGVNVTNGKGFTPPSPGKAVVYFARVTNYGKGVSYEFFDQDKYIGTFKKKNYMRYECNPGKNLLWASAENKEFVTADLQEGGTYILIVNVVMGWGSARVGMNPITSADTDLFNRAKELINSSDPIVTPDKKIADMNKKLEKFIKTKLDQYENEWKSTKNFKHISPEMAIPPESLK
jgi:hypothetical protein